MSALKKRTRAQAEQVEHRAAAKAATKTKQQPDSGSDSDDESSSASDSDGARPTPRKAAPRSASSNGHSSTNGSSANGHAKAQSTSEDGSDDSDSDSDSDDPSATRTPSSANGGLPSLSDSSDDSSSTSSGSDSEEDAAAAEEELKHHSSLMAGQHEDESDDEFALMRCDDPYPPMDWQNKARCLRFIKKTATNLKRVFMKKQVRRMRAVRHRYKEEGKTSQDAESDPVFLAHHAEYKLLERYNIGLLCELSWEYYWKKNKRVRFPADPAVTAEMKRWVREGLTHTMMRLAFQQIIKAHLHKLKRQARKIIKAVNRQERKDTKMDKMTKVVELTEMLKEARQPVPVQRVDQLKLGQVVEAIVDGVGPFGLFVVFWRGGEEVRGLVHVSELSEEYVADVAGRFHVGDQLNPVIIAVDPVKHKVNLSMKPAYYPDGAQPTVTHLAEHMREAALEERNARHSAATQPAAVTSVFLERIQKKIGLDESALEKIKQFYAVSAGASGKRNRMGQKQRRRLAEEVLGWQRKLRREERPLTKKQLKKARRKEEENMRRGIMPLTEAEKEEKRKFELAEKKARALRKYDKNKDRNKARKAEERMKREEKERRAKLERLAAKGFALPPPPLTPAVNGAANNGGGGPTPTKRQRTQ